MILNEQRLAADGGGSMKAGIGAMKTPCASVARERLGQHLPHENVKHQRCYHVEQALLLHLHQKLREVVSQVLAFWH